MTKLNSIILFASLIFTSALKAQIFHEPKSYELMYAESDLVVEAKEIGNKNVIIQKLFRDDDENFSVGDTLFIGWLSEFELRSPPPFVFLFLKKVDPSNVPAYNTIDIKPVSNSRYEHMRGGVIWYDSTGCYYYSESDHGYMRLMTVYDENNPHLPVFSKRISDKLSAFQPVFEKYKAARDLPDSTIKADLLASYLFRKNTPALPYYDFFAELELNDPNWTELSYEYSHALIPYLKESDDTSSLIYPLKALKLMNGGYYEYILLSLNDLLIQNKNTNAHLMIISLMGDKGDEYAIAMLRDQLHSKFKLDKELAALTLYSLEDKKSYRRIKKILLADRPAFNDLKELILIDPLKTKNFIKDVIPEYAEGSAERKALIEIDNW